jgi:hypothetical protein
MMPSSAAREEFNSSQFWQGIDNENKDRARDEEWQNIAQNAYHNGSQFQQRVKLAITLRIQ